eukprot:50767-Hanusia_phi.AAC.1
MEFVVLVHMGQFPTSEVWLLNGSFLCVCPRRSVDYSNAGNGGMIHSIDLYPDKTDGDDITFGINLANYNLALRSISTESLSGIAHSHSTFPVTIALVLYDNYGKHLLWSMSTNWTTIPMISIDIPHQFEMPISQTAVKLESYPAQKETFHRVNGKLILRTTQK